MIYSANIYTSVKFNCLYEKFANEERNWRKGNICLLDHARDHETLPSTEGDGLKSSVDTWCKNEKEGNSTRARAHACWCRWQSRLCSHDKRRFACVTDIWRILRPFTNNCCSHAWDFAPFLCAPSFSLSRQCYLYEQMKYNLESFESRRKFFHRISRISWLFFEILWNFFKVSRGRGITLHRDYSNIYRCSKAR